MINAVNHISPFTLGTVQLGMPYGRANQTGQPSLEEACKILKTALQHGVTCLDTARAYGESEAVLGKLLSTVPEAQAMVVTKLDPFIDLAWNAPAEDVVKATWGSINASLQALKFESLPILMLHRWQHRYDWNGLVWQTLLEAQEKGVVGKLGVSVQTPHELLTALEEPLVQAIQLPFNLLDWRWEKAGVPNALGQRPEVLVFARSVFLQGVLLAPAEQWPSIHGVSPPALIEGMLTICQNLNRKNLADLAVAYARSHWWIHSLVIGVETHEQLLTNLALFEEPLLDPHEVQWLKAQLAGAPEQLLNPALWP